MKALRIGIVGYEQCNALDLIGPAEAFTMALLGGKNEQPRRAYEVLVLGLTNQRFATESGVIFHPHATLPAAPPLDTILIPGGEGLRREETNRAIGQWVRSRVAQTRRIVSVCTGIYGLAPFGLLDERRVTTHWRFADDVARRFPKLRVEPNALFLKDGPFYTSAGVTAGIDLALALIEEDFGRKLALTVARELVVYLKRSGGQQQYSEPLQFQTESTDRMAELAAWIANNPNRDLSVEALARRACISPRHFARRFKIVFGQSPAAFVQDHRLDEARRRLSEGNLPIEAVATSVGFKSADAFRRAFRHRFRVMPSKYRRSFGLHAADSFVVQRDKKETR